jgi:lipopolysaccharide export system protein LptA
MGTNNAPATIDAEGDVVIIDQRDQGRATGSRAIYDSASGLAHLTGQPHWQDTLGRQAWAREFVFDRKTGVVRGEVEARSLLPGSVVGAVDVGFPGDSHRSKNLPASVFDIHADTISLSTGAGGEPRHIEAQRHVIMTNEVEQSWASADDAQFFQATGLLRLTGNAAWILGEDRVDGSVVELNNIQHTLAAHTNAVVRFPSRLLSAESKTQAGPGRNPSGPNAGATTNWPAPGAAPANTTAWVVVHSDDFLLRTNAAFFTDRVRAVETEDGERSVVLNCHYLETGFDEKHQIQNLLARGEVRGEEYPVKSRAAAGHLVCEQLKLAWYPGGKFLREVEAKQDVHADQTLFKPAPNPPVYREIRADALWASFSSRTNEVESGWADKNVFLLQKDLDPAGQGAQIVKSARGARGGHADYQAPPAGRGMTLTEHPVAWLEKTNSADIVLNADSLVWNPETGRFQGHGPYQIKPVPPADLPR